MDEAQAEKEASEGGLVGKGCEEHEAKVRAREERMAQKRKHAKEARGSGTEKEKRRKTVHAEGKAGWNASLHGEAGNEEERFMAGLAS